MRFLLPTLVVTDRPTIHPAQSFRRDGHDEDVSGDFLPVEASMVSCGGIVRCPPRIGLFWDAFFPLFLGIHRQICSVPGIGVAGVSPLGIRRTGSRVSLYKRARAEVFSVRSTRLKGASPGIAGALVTVGWVAFSYVPFAVIFVSESVFRVFFCISAAAIFGMGPGRREHSSG